MPRPQPPHDCGDLLRGCPPHLVPLPPSLPLAPHPVSHGRRNALIIAASVLAFLCACLSLYLFIRRRRLRLRQALLDAPEATAPAAVPEEEEGGGEEVVHHAWHIRTVGLDEAAIKSIALTRYRAGAGMLGAAYCSVCLGEFRDSELLRLLPNCGHAFHVPCIDTWLRTHVNCPLCRADVLDATATGDPDPPAGANAGTVAEQASNNIETLDHEQPGPGQQQNEQQELCVQIDQRDQPSSPEQSHRHPGSRMQNFRRVASTDSYLAPAAEAPEDEQNNNEKQGNGSDAACCKVSLSGSGRLHLMKRSLSAGGRWSLASRHCRTRSSVPPL